MNKVLIAVEFDSYEKKCYRCLQFSIGDKVGLVGEAGSFITSILYDNIECRGFRNIEVTIKGKTEIVNLDDLQTEFGKRN